MSNLLNPNIPGLVQIQGALAISDATYLAQYGQSMVEAAEAGIESQRRWTLFHMGAVEAIDPETGNKEWVRHQDSTPIPQAVFGLRARMFARLQEGVGHMAALKPKNECPLPEQEMRWLSHALGHEFIVSNMRENSRGHYVDCKLREDKPVARVGMDHEEYERFKATNPQWIDEDYRAHLGYRAVLLASARDLDEAAPDPGQAKRINSTQSNG
jgi:hypothetical protein